MKKEQEDERIKQRFEALSFDAGSLEEFDARLAALRGDPDTDDLRSMFCDHLLYGFCAGYVRYPKRDSEAAANVKRMFVRNVRLLPAPETWPYFQAVVCFFERDQKGCLRWLKRVLDVSRDTFQVQKLNEAIWADYFLDTFKNAFPGFWEKLADMLRNYPCEDAVVELCALVDAFYQCSTDDEAIDLLLPFAVQHPELSLPKELLGFSYAGKRLWHNAIACFEQVAGKTVLFYDSDIYFQLAWCCGKLRDKTGEERNYRACLASDPGYPNALNNLGYCLYRQKRYAEAVEILEQCLRDRSDLPYSANNYVRALLAAGQNGTAREFVRRGEFKLSSELRKKVLQRDGIDQPLASSDPGTTALEPEDAAEAEDNLPDFGIRHLQFSSERVLEDELTARIEAGREVFGRKLRIYQRTGDFYGRQYPIEGGKGRLDLFCEDEDGNLYAIELKKDSGYDDPYEQTKHYVEWLRKHRCKTGKRVYGIICLNDPTERLKEQVRGDESLFLYEYQISYREIR